MRIGVFSDSYKPYTSGVVTSISTFRDELTRLGHEIFIFAPNYPNYDDQEPEIYRFYSLPSPTNPEFTLAIPVLPGMNMLVRKLQLDIIHVHSPFTMGRVGLHYSGKYNLPLVFTYHTMYDQYVHYVPVAQDLAREVTIKYSNNFCNHCDHIVVPSHEVRDILQKYEVRTPITVIPTGVPVEKLKGGHEDWLRLNYDIPGTKRILLYVGRLGKEKNLEFLIRSFKLVHDKMPDTTLVITAQGPMESQLKKQVTDLKLSLQSDVIFTGVVPFDTLVHVYHSSDLFVFASMTETQGLVIAEAMAAGLPVVAVRAAGVQDMVDHGINGMLTQCDIYEFSSAICKVLEDKEIYRYYRNNALKKSDNLSSTTMARKMEQLYMVLISQNVNRRNRSTDLNSRFTAL